MSSQPSPSANRTILPIQYLRGVAALMVVWRHAVEQLPGISSFLNSGFGTAGVDLFFVISGFIMVVTTSRTATSPAGFMRRRIVRVVPLYWLLTLLMVMLAIAMPSLFKTLIVAPDTLVKSLLFIPHVSRSFPDHVWPLLVPGWTLNFEMFFYAVFALSLALPARTRLPALALAFGALAAAGLAFGPLVSPVARVCMNPMLLEFVAGAAIGTWWQRHGRMPGAAPSALMVAGGFAILVSHDLPLLGEFTRMTGAALVVAGALSPRFQHWQSAPLRALGDSSYSLYLSHLFTLGVLRVVWGHLVAPIAGLGGAVAFVATALVVSSVAGWFVYRRVEMPMLGWFNARLRARPPRLAQAAPSTL